MNRFLRRYAILFIPLVAAVIASINVFGDSGRQLFDQTAVLLLWGSVLLGLLQRRFDNLVLAVSGILCALATIAVGFYADLSVSDHFAGPVAAFLLLILPGLLVICACLMRPVPKVSREHINVAAQITALRRDLNALWTEASVLRRNRNQRAVREDDFWSRYVKVLKATALQEERARAAREAEEAHPAEGEGGANTGEPPSDK